MNDGSLPFGGASERFGAVLRSRGAPIVAGVLAALAAAYAWGISHRVLLVPDEAAYLLQAKLYAGGRWTAAAAPIPEFFEQLYVFVTPFTAAKYPPGFPIALVPGVWLGAPLLVPIILVGVSGGLLFALARDVANEHVAALAWLIWTTTPYMTWPLPPFLSQNLSTALWLASGWALLRWHRTASERYLVLLACFLGWGAITRPLTMLAAAIPAGWVIAGKLRRSSLWKSALVPVGIVLAFLLVIPLWSLKTTSDWKVTPLALYVRTYTPYDGLGFQGRLPSAELGLPPDLQEITRRLDAAGREHTLSNLPGIAAKRLLQIRSSSLPGWRTALAPIALYGLLRAPGPALFAASTGALNFAAHLFLAHPSDLPVYYFETYPLLAFLAAWGIWKVVAGSDPHRRQFAGFVLFALALVPAAADLYGRRLQLRLVSERKARFESAIRALPGRAIVFVRYSRPSDAFRSFVENGPDLSRERIWIVRDLGAENARLEAAAPGRQPYLYQTGPETLTPLSAPSKTSSRTPSEVPR